MNEGKKRVRNLTSREARFAELLVAGFSQSDAFRMAYKKPKGFDNQTAAEKAWVVANRPLVKERVAALRERSGAKALLTLNDRLGILARDAQLPGTTPAHVNARTRVLDVYSKLAGDYAPQKVELTGKDGAPVPIAGTVLVGRMSVRDKLRALKEARAARAAAEAEPNKP